MLHDLLFQKPDSIGLWSWGSVAERIGVPDTTAFGQCMASEQTRHALHVDSLAGVDIGVSGTPTVLVNEWLLPPGAPSDSLLDEIIARELRRGS
jgi:predicted DsbA family dithiol-disulfide isomerase